MGISSLNLCYACSQVFVFYTCPKVERSVLLLIGHSTYMHLTKLSIVPATNFCIDKKWFLLQQQPIIIIITVFLVIIFIFVPMTRCGCRVAEYLTSSFHVSWLCSKVWVSMSYFPVYSVTLKNHPK